MKPLFFLWIKKTGGTTLHNAVKSWFHNPYQGDWTGQIPLTHDYYTGHVSASRLEDIRDDVYKVTVIRDPIKRVISFYNYYYQHGFWDGEQTNNPLREMTFTQFLNDDRFTEQVNNYMTGVFGGSASKAASILSGFDLVGILDLKLFGLQYVVNQLATRYGRKIPVLRPMNTSQPFVTYSTLKHSDQVELHERNQLDLMLYEYAQKLIFARVS